MAVTLGDDADGTALVDDDGGAVRPLAHEREDRGDGLVGADGHRRLVHRVRPLDPRDRRVQGVDQLQCLANIRCRTSERRYCLRKHRPR